MQKDLLKKTTIGRVSTNRTLPEKGIRTRITENSNTGIMKTYVLTIRCPSSWQRPLRVLLRCLLPRVLLITRLQFVVSIVVWTLLGASPLVLHEMDSAPAVKPIDVLIILVSPPIAPLIPPVYFV